MAILKGIATRPASRAAMQLKETAWITAGSGVEGDIRGKPGKRQVTVLSLDGWRAACAALDAELEWTDRRANLLVEGIEFDAAHVGAVIRIGEVELEITQETAPCPRMDEAHPGLMEALAPAWRGGVCCRVLRSGQVAVGDTAVVER